MNIIYLIVQNKNCIFNECSEKNTIFVAFDNYKMFLYDNTDTLLTVLNSCNLYEIYEYIKSNYNVGHVFRCNNFNYCNDLTNYPNISFSSLNNKNILSSGFKIDIKSLTVLIDNKINFDDEENNTIKILKKNEIYLNNNTKNAVIFFHKNIYKLYPKHWIELCKNSVLNQKNIDFDILEINYGGENSSIFVNNEIINKKHYFYNVDLKTHTDAMTFLLNIGFNDLEYDIIYNTNLDDYYDETRFYKQYKCIMDGYYLCSSLWHYVKEKNNVDEKGLIFTKELLGLNTCNNNYIDFNEIKYQLSMDHNVINHSGVCFTKKIWTSYDINWNLLRYRDDKPFEDLTFWNRIVNVNIPITIIDEDLIYYRIHDNQIGSNKDKNNENIDSGFKKEPNKLKKRIGFYIKNDTDNVEKLYNYINSINKLDTEYTKTFYIISSFDISSNFIDNDNLHICNDYSQTINYFYPSIETQVDILYYFYTDISIYNFYNNLPTPTKPIIETKDIFKAGITHYFLKNFRI
jgi:hypothetical protein